MAKKWYLFFLLALSVSSAYAQSLFYQYTKYDRKTEERSYFLRIYRIIDDVTVKCRDYALYELLGESPNCSPSHLFVDLNNDMDIISFYIDDEPKTQYAIDKDARLRKIEFYERNSEKSELRDELAAIKEYGDKNKIVPYNGWVPERADSLRKLDSKGRFIYSADDNPKDGSGEIWLIKKDSLNYVLEKIDQSASPFGEFLGCLVCYAENKITYVGLNGIIGRADISDMANPKPIAHPWKAFQAAVGKRDSRAVANSLIYQIDPFDKADGTGKHAIECVFETKDADFILSCLIAIDAAYGLPLRRGCEELNPVDRIIGQNDASTLKKVLEWKPELANLVPSGCQFSGAAPARYLVADDNVAFMRILIPYIPDINQVVCLGTKESDGGGAYNHACNLLSFAKSSEMKSLLIKAGVKTLIPLT